MKKTLKEYTFTSFGFPVLLNDINIKETECGEEYPDINIKTLELVVVRALIKSSVPFTGAKLKFLRKFLKLSLRDLGYEIGAPHTSLKLWEDDSKEKTGLSSSQEKKLKYLILIHIQVLEQKELSKIFFEDAKDVGSLNAPLEVEYKYGA